MLFTFLVGAFASCVSLTYAQVALSNHCHAIVNLSPNQSGNRPPNLVLIMIDDLGKEWVGCYGAENIETPNMDALAADGMRFECAYSMPQCTPSRVTLLTGQYPFRHGWTNHFDVPRWGSGCHFDPDLNTSFPKLLRELGYHTAIAGKWQIDDFRVEPGALDQAGFNEWCVWTGGEGGNPKSNERYWEPYVFEGSTSEIRKEVFGPDVYCDFLVNFIGKHHKQPMFVYFPMTLTHGPLVPTPDDPEADEMLTKHKAMVRYTDKLIGRIVDAFRDRDLLEETIIIVTTDNGTSRGIAGRRLGREVEGAKAKMSEAGTAMPFIAYGKGRVPSGVVTNALVDFTDILPTFVALAGGQVNQDTLVDGHSFAPLLLGEASDSAREWVLSQGGGPATFRNNRTVPVHEYDDRVIRDKRWKLWIGTDRQATAFYDLMNDPWEENNLLRSNDPEVAKARERLWQVVLQMPEKDAAPRYKPNPAQTWDRFEFVDEE